MKAMRGTRRYRAVLFDLGWTLVKGADSPEVFKRILQAHGVTVSYEIVSKAHGENRAKFDEEAMARMGPRFWVSWNLEILDGIGVRENREFLAKEIDESWFDYADLGIYPEVPETLSQLRARNVRVGIVTNGFERDYTKILQKLGLTGQFDAVVGIDACNKAKPHRDIFLHAVNMLNVRPEEAIFVGDSVELDYRGATDAGLRALLIDRDGRAPVEIESIRSLMEILDYF